ncbi:brachyurin-like isoform X1 [Neocloeon triangulifer]|uniref:brachyurin-like isoform X1 n=1 Tax=Neocloeon triangulifer TaxID=2078957 RepID=UPI00286F52A2|nr:brachyurin-like isoform X1 [Neocloeon triangulifer]
MQVSVNVVVRVCFECLSFDSSNATSINLTFPFQILDKRRPISYMTAAEVLAYEENETNVPKIDFVNTNGTYFQPDTAGISFLDSNSSLTPQIIGGNSVQQRQFPWLTLIIINLSSMCGGSLISERWVLTACHCTRGMWSGLIFAGGINRLINETFEFLQFSMSSSCHENYNDIYVINDISVIRLASPFTLTEFVNVVQLPRISDATNYFAGITTTAAGYGRTSDSSPFSIFLQAADLSTIINSKCAAYYGGQSIVSSSLCTGIDPTKATCEGDSGGPLVYKETATRYTQIGIVSFSSIDGCLVAPAAYTRVTSYLGWISAKTGIIIRM